MELSLITDEISQDLDEAARFAVDHEVRKVAIRSVWGRNIMECAADDAERIADRLAHYDLEVTSVLSPLFKCPTRAADTGELVDPHFVGFPPVRRLHIEAASSLPAIATTLGAKILRIFTFLVSEEADGDLASAEAATIRSAVADWDVTAAVENEYVCHVRTLSELSRFCSANHLPAIIDPCNHAYLEGAGTVLAGLTDELLRQAVDVHVKDRTAGAYVPVGDGDLPWPEIIGRLADSGFAGPVTLESHLRGDREGIAASIARLRQWGIA